MTEIVPSYIRKIDRAVEHLNEFKRMYDEYVNSDPYTITNGREGKKQVHRLQFTSQIDPRAKMIATDLIYNVRSGLDHLAAALNPPRQRTHVMFPILSEGVWEAAIAGKNEDRAKAHKRWSTTTREMQSGAVTILKGLQPPESGQNDARNAAHLLTILNRLSNKDRHSELPMMPTGLANSAGTWQLPGSDEWFTSREPRNWGMVRDNAEIGLPVGAMNVRITGTTKIAIRTSGPEWDVEIPLYFENVINFVRENVFTPLFAFLWVAPNK